MREMIKRLSFGGRLPVAPSMDGTLTRAHVPSRTGMIDRSVIINCALAVALAVVASLAAQFLAHLIGFFTNLFFYHRIALEFVPPFEAPDWGWWVIPVPVVGGLIVGVMARYGSKAIRGHGIPEAMEQILTNESRIPLRVTFLKPISAAISIGTGGPFGAEGPIIATGAALGSVTGQWLKTTADTRKCLLAAGAAAVLLAVELLLFEFRPRSLIPVALAAATAEAMHMIFEGTKPVFPMGAFPDLAPSAFLFAIAIGLVMGLVSVVVTKIVYGIEDAFEHLPVHWMWWPALGGLAVGVVGYFFPRTMGVGYGNIVDVISGNVAPMALAIFTLMKFISWSVSLGSGTSGGTLAPLFTIGGGIGALIGFAVQAMFPELGITPGIAGLIGMASIFAGASRALLASVVFAFEVTQQPMGLMPLLAGCSVAYLVSGYLMRNSIMTEKIARRGVRIPADYTADLLDQVLVRDFARMDVVTLMADQEVDPLIPAILAHDAPYTHQGYPVLDEQGKCLGIVTRKDFARAAASKGMKVRELIARDPIAVFASQSLREAADLMVVEGVGRVPVMDVDKGKMIGILSRTDLLRAHEARLKSLRRG